MRTWKGCADDVALTLNEKYDNIDVSEDVIWQALDDAYVELCQSTWACCHWLTLTSTRADGYVDLATLFVATGSGGEGATDPFDESNDNTNSIALAMIQKPGYNSTGLKAVYSEYEPARNRHQYNTYKATYPIYLAVGHHIYMGDLDGSDDYVLLPLAFIGPRRRSGYENNATYPKFHADLQDVGEAALIALAAAKVAIGHPDMISDTFVARSTKLEGQLKKAAVGVHGNEEMRPYVSVPADYDAKVRADAGRLVAESRQANSA